MRMFRKDEGFTLVELMVVVLIIGILVAVAIPIFNSASENARGRTCQSNQRTIEGAVQQYLARDAGQTWAAAVIDGADPLSKDQAYIKTPPTCPSAASDTANLYGVDASGTVRSDKMASGGTVPTADDFTDGHTHY